MVYIHRVPPCVSHFLNIKIHLGHGTASLLTSLFELHFQYFKMDSGTFDDYGGVEHAEYCFQVYFLFSILHVANFCQRWGI